jgi:hypothetical protein
MEKRFSSSLNICLEARADIYKRLKVHKNENFFGFDFEFCTVSEPVMLKHEGFVKINFLFAHYGGW